MPGESNFDENKLDANDPAEIHRLMVSLSLQEIRERLGGELSSMVDAFLMEMDSARAVDVQAFILKTSGGRTAASRSNASRNQMARMWGTWERWLPLIRKEFFMKALESEILLREARHKDDQNYFEGLRVIARDLNSMSEEEVKEYFEICKDPEKHSKTVTDGLAMDLCEKAEKALHEGDLTGAGIYYQRAIAAFEKTGNEWMLASCTHELANVIMGDGQVLQAEKLYEEAAKAFEQCGDTTNLTIALSNLGHSMLSRGELKSAYQIAMRGIRAAKLGEPETDPGKFAELLLHIAARLPEPEQIHGYRRIIQTFDEMELKEYSASAHLRMGSKLAQAKRFDEGCEAALKGVKLMIEAEAPPERIRWATGFQTHIWMEAGRTEDEIRRSFKEVFGTSGEMARLGELYVELTQEVRAGKLSLDQALRLLREEHNRKPFDARAIATLCEDLRETVRALPRREIPDEILEELAARYEISHRLLMLAADLAGAQEFGNALYLSLGIIYDQMGRLTEAAETFERGAELARLQGNIQFFISMRLNSAKAFERAGDQSASISRLELLLKELKEINVIIQQPDDYPRVCRDLAGHYYDQQRLHEAESTASNGLQALTALHETDPKIVFRLQEVEHGLRALLGIIYKATERYVSAEPHFRRCLELSRILKNDYGMTVALANLAGVRSDLGDTDEALRLYNQAYQAIEQLPGPSYTFIYTERARALSHAGQHAEARRMAVLALEMNPTARQAAKCAVVLLRTATTEAERRDAQSRAELILSSNPTPEIQFIILSELLKEEVEASPEQRNEWRAQLRGVRDSLEGLQGALVNLYVADMLSGSEKDSEAAIEYLERCLELIDEAAARNQDRDTQRHIFTTGDMAAQRLLQLKPGDNCAGLEVVLRAKARATLNQQFTSARTVEELRNQLLQQPEPILLVEMYTLPAETLLYFITADGLQGVEHIPITAETFEAENHIIGKLGDFRLHEAAWRSETWLRLSEAFTGALSRYLQPKQLVCLIPAGFWHFLPLHAGLLDGRPLIERHPVYYGPSSGVLSRPGDGQRRLDNCLSVGVEFEQEAAWVADWFGVKGALLGPMAHLHTVIRSIRKADLVHFSCHGSYNPWRGSESGVLLEYQSWLTPSLIEEGATDADLVTLSACETAFDFVTAANDMVGLDTAFLNMGTVSVLGTLWAVDAEATEIFVRAFYENLTGSKGSKLKRMSKAHALQAAVAQVRRNSGSEHPFYWAAFKLTGGWL
jgi:tetratricopeptide (TPR) repeat protein